MISSPQAETSFVQASNTLSGLAWIVFLTTTFGCIAFFCSCPIYSYLDLQLINIIQEHLTDFSRSYLTLLKAHKPDRVVLN